MTDAVQSQRYDLLACVLVNNSAAIDREIQSLKNLAAPGAELRLWLMADNPSLKRREIEELAELHCPGSDVLLVIHDGESDDDELQAALACLENAEVLVIDHTDSFSERVASELTGRCEVVRL